MFFKRIEMTGFKSFATKTVVDFKPGVTVIVGPNGCGKSNIFDAIRWVLGEQSAKSLRGQKMGDVIFQGSATYKPMGCSQITLVINNEGRRLPIDYSEVSITRRLYRSGESEYQLNKMPCRLRDINELFLDTGVGTDSYSIMEQGKVGDIVKSRPEDRRELFEEAAGISKYKARKAEALRKLERTESDLIRLADRITESRTRRNSLKRQAAKAERFKALKDASDEVDMKLMTLEFGDISNKIERVEKEYSEAKDKLAVVRAESDMVQARREALLLQMEVADETLRDLTMQREDQRKYISEIGHEITRLKSQSEGERLRADDMNRQLDDVAVRYTEFSRNLAEANIEEVRLSIRQIKLQARQNIRKAEFERLRADSASTRKKIGSLRTALEGNNEEIMRLKSERARLDMQLTMARMAVEEFNTAKREHEEALARYDAQIAEMVEQLNAKREELKRLQKELETARKNAMEAVRAREVLQGEHRTVERELQQGESRLNALQKLAHDYEGYYGGVKALMQASRDHMLDGVMGVVPELIQAIDPEHDLAVEIALGNHLQSIVMRSAQDAKRAIEYLKSERLGRATLLPLDLLDTREDSVVERVLGRHGVVGVASRLVTHDTYIQRAVDFLLGRTVVTDNTDVSLQLTRGGDRGRYVTLDGQLTSPGGAMTGGSRGKSQIVTRQREITDLEAKVRELTETESDLAGRIARRERSMVDLNVRGEELRGKIQELRLVLGNGETELAGLRNTQAERQRQFDGLKRKAESSESTTAASVVALATCNGKLGVLEEALNAQRREMSVMEDVVYDRNVEVDRMGEHVNQVDKEILSLSNQCDHLRERAGAYVAERESMQRSRAQILVEQRRCREEAKGHLSQAARVESEKKALEQEVQGIAALCEKAAKEKEQAQQTLHKEGDRSQRLMSDLTLANNRYNEAQAEHINIEGTLKRLSERAKDRFERELRDLVSQVGEVDEDRADLTDQLQDLKREIVQMGDNINMGALVEYREAEERYEFLTAQEKDLMEARDSLTETIATIDKTTSKLFFDAFEAIRQNFQNVYRRLFGGGKADLVLSKVEDGDPLLDAGVEIQAQPPGKRLQNISLLSGGEQALTAVSLMFAIFMYKPSPFCVLDEIDAPLDDANVLRFRDMLQEFARETQFIIITHNKMTMELADTIYGITMQETGVSSLVSVAFDQVDALHMGAV